MSQVCQHGKIVGACNDCDYVVTILIKQAERRFLTVKDINVLNYDQIQKFQLLVWSRAIFGRSDEDR